MSNKENRVMRVLATSGNHPVVTASTSTISNLLPGQIGFFNKDTGNGVDTVVDNKFYVTLARDVDGDTVVDDVLHSAGYAIALDEVESVTIRCYSPVREQVLRLTGATPKCDDYTVKFELVSPQIFNTYGNQGLYKTYVSHTNACTGDCDCTSPDSMPRVFADIMNQINKDIDKLIVAEALVGGIVTAVTQPQLDALILGTSITPAIDGLQFTIKNKPKAFDRFNYDQNTGYTANVSLTGGFESNGTITQTVAFSVEEGDGKFIKYLEFVSDTNTNTSGPYVAGALTNTVKDFISNATENGKYVTVWFNYKNNYESGWRDIKSSYSTLLAIPCTDTVTIESLSDLFLPLQNTRHVNITSGKLELCSSCTAVTASGVLFGADAGYGQDNDDSTLAD